MTHTPTRCQALKCMPAIDNAKVCLTYENVFICFCPHIRPTQLLNATGRDVDIDDCQVLKYQPPVTS